MSSIFSNQASLQAYKQKKGVQNEQKTPISTETPKSFASGYKPKSLFGQYSDLVNTAYSAYKKAPVIKQGSQAVGAAVGAAGTAIGGFWGGILTPYANVAKGIYKEGFGSTVKKSITDPTSFYKGTVHNMVSTAESTKEFGTMIGEEGAAQAPFGAAGKAGQIPLAIGATSQGIEDIHQGNTGWGALEIGLGILGTKSALSRKGLFVDQAFKREISESPLYTKLKGISSKTPSSSEGTIASLATGESKELFQKAADPERSPAIMSERQEILSPETTSKTKTSGVLKLGEEIYEKASSEKDAAYTQWKTDNAAVLESVKGRVPKAHIDVADSIKRRLSTKEYGARLNFDESGNIDFKGTRFSANSEAQTAITDAIGILDETPLTIDDMLDNQIALEYIQKNLNAKTQGQARGLLGDIKSQYDLSVDELTGGKSSELRSNYAKTIAPVKTVMNQMVSKDTRGTPVFSKDKSMSFVNKVLQGENTDAWAALRDLDNLAGTNLTAKAENIGIARTLSQETAALRGGWVDIFRRKISQGNGLFSGVVGGAASPYLWGEIFLRKGLNTNQAMTAGMEARNTLLNEIIRASLRNAETRTISQ